MGKAEEGRETLSVDAAQELATEINTSLDWSKTTLMPRQGLPV
ncbi:MAG: hypothetical protein WCC14_01885 [Acidobacteriaceae bacterium]